MNQSDNQKPTNAEVLRHFAQDNSSMKYLEAHEFSLDGGLTVIARKWKQNKPKEPLNAVDTRTFAERVEECLTIKAFRAWLESKWSDDEVGIAGSAIDNPIHHFLRLHFKEARAGNDRDEFPRLEVYYTEIVLYLRFLFQSANCAAMPFWASKFSSLLDSCRYQSGDAAPVTAEQALAILAEVEKELADTSEKEEV